jgi:hypothetical protein
MTVVLLIPDPTTSQKKGNLGHAETFLHFFGGTAVLLLRLVTEQCAVYLNDSVDLVQIKPKQS